MAHVMGVNLLDARQIAPARVTDPDSDRGPRAGAGRHQTRISAGSSPPSAAITVPMSRAKPGRPAPRRISDSSM